MNARTARIYLNEGLATMATISSDIVDNPLVIHYANGFRTFLKTAERPRIKGAWK